MGPGRIFRAVTETSNGGATYSHLDNRDLDPKEGALATYERVADLHGRNVWPMDARWKAALLWARQVALRILSPGAGAPPADHKSSRTAVFCGPIGYDGKAVVFERLQNLAARYER